MKALMGWLILAINFALWISEHQYTYFSELVIQEYSLVTYFVKSAKYRVDMSIDFSYFVNLSNQTISHLTATVMKNVNPERLKSARLLAGLSLRQLQEKMANKISHNAINKYETGQMLPEAGTIISLADILKVPAAYFYEMPVTRLDNISFRKKISLSNTETEQIKLIAGDRIERYLETENLLGLSAKFINPVKNRQIEAAEEAEEMAKMVRAEWGLGYNPIANVIETLEENAVKVIEVEASEKFDGLSTYVEGGVPVAVVNERFAIERKRFTVLHELGHLMMDIRIANEKEAERACHRFAGAFLFPATEVRRTLGERRKNIAMGELVAIKEEYGISVQAAMRRAVDLDIIPHASYKTFCMRIASNRKEEGLGSFKGEEKSYRLTQLVFRLYAEGAIDEAKAARLSGLKTNAFRALYQGVPEEENKTLYDMSNAVFANAWVDDEPEYSLNDIKSLNPDYEGW